MTGKTLSQDEAKRALERDGWEFVGAEGDEHGETVYILERGGGVEDFVETAYIYSDGSQYIDVERV